MKKIAITAMVMFSLAACQEDNRERNTSESGRGYIVECIDGVEYWVRALDYRGGMAVRINPETLSPVTCK